ncbi:MAG: hypothetical protein ABI877_05510 [Gemmatimonadaceae bacterium]
MPDTSIERQWRPTGLVAPTALVDARLQAHHAAQLVVSAAISYLAPRADDSHTNLEWQPDLSAMAGNVLSNASGARFALRPADLTLLALSKRGAVVDEFALSGHTIKDADVWMRAALARLGFDAGRLTQKKHYEIPTHQVATGHQFQLAADGSNAELASYYHDAWCLTSTVRDEREGAPEPRIWPHHFDLATLIAVATPQGSASRTIGVGLSPGDDSYPQPYIYVGPSPSPPVDRLPPLSVGRWHTAGWVGAVLTGAEFLGDKGADRALAFSRQAIAACEQALGAL